MFRASKISRAALLVCCLWLSACASQGFLRSAPPPPMGEKRQPGQVYTDVPPAFPPSSYQDAIAPAEAQVVKIGLLVPMSGEAASIGTSLLDAASLAIFDRYAKLSPREQTVRVVLVPKDTGGAPATAVQAAEAVLNENVQMVLGPLFSSEAKAVAPLAKARGVPMFSFSNQESVAGQGVFTLGLKPEEQVARILDFTLQNRFTRFALLAPSDPYGQAVTKAFTTKVKEGRGSVVLTEFYRGNTQALVSAAERMARKIKTMEVEQRPQALLIPEGGERLKKAVETLVAGDVNPAQIRLLGTGKWDDAETLGVNALMGGWLASTPAERTQWFEQRFFKAYGYRPPRLASLGYDAAALAAALAFGPQGPDYSMNALTSPVGFDGPANGIFRCAESGICEHGLAVLEVTPSGFRDISPAPAAFQ